jgi:hypothetical protein
MLEEARTHESELLVLLDQEVVTSLDRNQVSLWYKTGEGAELVHLRDLPIKEYFVYYNAALTSYLLNRDEEAQQYIDKASAIDVGSETASQVRRLIEFETNRLRDEHPTEIKRFQERWL